MCEAIVNYIPKLGERFHDIWIIRFFAVEESAISGEHLAAKVEFLQSRKNSQLKADFVNQKLGTFGIPF